MSEQRLDALYAELPALECIGKCAESCGPIAMSDAERARIKARGVEIPHWNGKDFDACPALDLSHQCTVYEVRPMICRLWGMVEGMPCEWGCVPVGGRLPDAAARDLLRGTAVVDALAAAALLAGTA